MRFGCTHKCNIQIPVRQQRKIRFRTTSVSGQVTHSEVSLPVLKGNEENRVRDHFAATCVSSCTITLTHPFKSKALMSMCCRTSSDVIWGSTAKERNSTGSAPSHFWKTRDKTAPSYNNVSITTQVHVLFCGRVRLEDELDNWRTFSAFQYKR